ncbi:MAG: hypothetical protein RIG66_19220 [Coleofasciculus sp. E2-BRE-01]
MGEIGEAGEAGGAGEANSKLYLTYCLLPIAYCLFPDKKRMTKNE